MSAWIIPTVVGLGSIALGAAINQILELKHRPRIKVYKSIRSMYGPFSPEQWPPFVESGEEATTVAKYWYLTAKNLGAREARDCLPLLFFTLLQDKINVSAPGLWVSPSAFGISLSTDISDYEIPILPRAYVQFCAFLIYDHKLFYWSVVDGIWTALIDQNSSDNVVLTMTVTVQSTNAPTVTGWEIKLIFDSPNSSIVVDSCQKKNFEKHSPTNLPELS